MPLQEFEQGVDKTDINRIYDQLQPLIKEVATITATLKAIVHKAPCVTLNRHLTEHSAQKQDWKRAIMTGVVDIVKMGIVAALTYFIILANGGS